MNEVGSTAGFAATKDGRWMYSGMLTLQNAGRVFAVASKMPLPSSGTIDFSGLAQADSAALAVAIALKRRAAAERRTVSLQALPATLMTLAVAYGVEELLA